MVEVVYSTYARGAKQYGRKGTGERQMKQSQTKAGAGGLFLFKATYNFPFSFLINSMAC